MDPSGCCDGTEQEAFFNSLVKWTDHNGELTDEQRHAPQRFFVLDESYFAASWDEIHKIAGSLDH